MHWNNAKIISKYINADLIWSYPNVNDNIKNYDVIIFNHASNYSYVDKEWLNQNPDAKLFYITNEYNLGEPYILWKLAKEGRKYTVIANHESNASKVVKKYTNEWIVVNLNSIIYEPKKLNNIFLEMEGKQGCIYHGSFRKDREIYYKKYLDRNVLLSTHNKNIENFRLSGANSNTINRINWKTDGLFPFKNSLYIEDVKTHSNYNFLANRFYESLNYDCVPIFSEECKNTTNLSGYDIGIDYFINDSSQIKSKEHLICKQSWHEKAYNEKLETLTKIKTIIES